MSPSNENNQRTIVLAPCQVRCPIHENIQRTNVLISLLPIDPDAARARIIAIGDELYQRNPLFTVCGYVCGLCELDCSSADRGGAIRRRLLKRFLSDWYTPYLPEKPAMATPSVGKHIAVIGGGPAGLIAAYDLRQRGYRVTIFEATAELGGALWLIPHYRLPEDVLKTALDNLVRIAGIEVRFNTRIGEPASTLARLLDDGFSAAFVARGTPVPRILTFAGRTLDNLNLSGIMHGNTFLYEVSHGNLSADYFRGRRVLVTGGGNTALDAARTARRLGADTTIVCLENAAHGTRDGINAELDEIQGALEEGVQFIHSRGVMEIKGNGQEFTGISAPRCTRLFDEQGFNPQFDLSDTVEIFADVLVIAVGQGPEWPYLRHEGLLDDNGRLDIDPVTLQSRRTPWVFAGGDMKHVGYLAEAMADGFRGGTSIDRFLQGKGVQEGEELTYLSQKPPLRHANAPQPGVTWIPPEKRLHFGLFETGFTLEEAITEARRCLNCGPCSSCEACVAAGLQPSLPQLEVDENSCSGCGLCATACPYGAVIIREGDGHRISITDRLRCKACGSCVADCPARARSIRYE